MRNQHNFGGNWPRGHLVFFLIVALAFSTIAVQPSEAQTPVPVGAYTLEGTVKDYEGRALKDAKVVANPSGGGAQKTAATDASGKYRIEQLAGGTWNVTANHSCCLPAFSQVTFQGTGVVVVKDFELKAKDQPVSGKSVTLKGFVREEKTTKTLANVLINIDNYFDQTASSQDTASSPIRPGGGYQHFSIATGADGSYAVDLNPGSISLNVDKAGYDYLYANFEMRENRTLDLPMRPAENQSATLFGTVLSSTGRPLAFASISGGPDYECRGDVCVAGAEPAPSSSSGDVYFYYNPRNSQYNWTQADEQGRWEMRILPGALLIQGYAENHLEDRERVTVESGQRREVRLVLEKVPDDSVRVHGKVVDAETDDSISYAQVNLENQQWGHYNSTMTKEDGTYEFWTKPGYTIVTASAYKNYWTPCPARAEPASENGSFAPEPYPCPADGPQERDHDYMPRITSFVGASNQSQTLDFQLVQRPAPDAVFQGYVVNASNQKAIAGATVTFYNELTRDWGSAITDEDGSYKILVHAGYYTVRAYAEHYFDGVLNAEIGRGDEQRLDVPLTPGEKRYGYYGPVYAVADRGDAQSGAPSKEGSAVGAPAPVPPGAFPPPQGASPSPTVEGQEAYFGSGGGLGPYRPGENGGAGAPGPAFAALIVGLITALFLAARRRR